MESTKNTSESTNPGSNNRIILHVVVIGFHHKKGCQVDYAYPPFQTGDAIDNTECPEEWKQLPSLALPDGSHNYEKDTTYFHMPSRDNPSKTVYGISCYRQINAESLLNRSSDVTRGTVQKSVCIISTLPLYGLINAKLELITHAYFDERDFSKVSLLEDTFESLNASLNDELPRDQHIFLGLSVRNLVLHFKHKVVLLVKLVLLERKVLFLQSPVKDLCTTILSLLSLFPGLLEHGLERCNELGPYREPEFDVISSESANEIGDALTVQISENEAKVELPDANVLQSKTTSLESGKLDRVDKVSRPTVTIVEPPPTAYESDKCAEEKLLSELEELLECDTKERVDLASSKLEFQERDTDVSESCNNDGCEDEHNGSGETSSLSSKCSNTSSTDGLGISKIASLKGRVMGAIGYWSSRSDKMNGSVEGQAGDAPVEINGSAEYIGDAVVNDQTDAAAVLRLDEEPATVPPLSDIINLDINKCGLPLQIFAEGMLCHPYLSLPFLDLLKDCCVRGFVAGATNVLFKQKRHLMDVIVEVDEDKLEILNNDLRKQLHLTTEDLRFADFLVRNVTEDHDDIFLDDTGWEGGEEWLRAQFKWYILCLLRTSMLQDRCQEIETFNESFMSAWKQTKNYEVWNATSHWSVLEINPGHPFQGQLSMADMKLRISHTMQNSERGRKINQAVVNTGKAVAQTSKALGGALSQAKSTVSSWLQMFGAPPPSREE